MLCILSAFEWTTISSVKLEVLVHDSYVFGLYFNLSMYYLTITAASHIKPSSSSNDHVIVDSLTEGSPHQPAFKSM